MKPKKLLSLFMAMVMLISILPTFSLTVSAESAKTTEKNITLGAAALKGGQQSNVYFGRYWQSIYDGDYEVSTVLRPNFEHEGANRYYKVNVPASGVENVDWIRTTTAVLHGLNVKCNVSGALPEEYEKYAYYNIDPIKWRVLDTAFDYDANSTQGAADATTSIFLLSDKNLDAVKYNETNTAVTWKDSTIRTWLNDSFFNSAFSESEKSLIYQTAAAQSSKVFLPSVEEIKNADYGFSSKTALNTTYVYGGASTGSENLAGKGVANDYWLRSDANTNTPPFVWYTGTLDEDGYFTVDNEDIGVRPALNINSKTILFTSAAKSGKNINIGTVLQNADFDSISDNDGYKLTFSDSSRNFSVTETQAIADRGRTLAFTYKDAKAGDNEYISAMIVKDGEVLYYGQLKNTKDNSDASGMVEFSVPNDIAYGKYTLKLFNEQINGDYLTDLSSGFADVSLTVKEEAVIPDTEKTIALGYSALSDGDTENAKFDYIYYAIIKNKIEFTKWRVLSTKGNSTKTGAGNTDTATYKTAAGTVYTGDALFCISDEVLVEFPFGADAKWQGSAWQTYIQSDKIFDNDLKEMKYVLKTTKTDSAENFSFEPNKPENLETTELKDDTFFPISAREAEQYLGNANLKTPKGLDYWLRSPAYDYTYVVYVTSEGNYNIKAPSKALGSFIRPAFNLDLSSVLFTSKATGAKTVNVGTVSKIEEVANFNEYKLTMKEAERTFNVVENQVDVHKGGAAALTYTNARTDNSEYISVIILDKDGNAEYYGQIAYLTDDDQSSGTVNFNVPNDLAYGSYTMYVFNEQLNADCDTDFASAFQTVTLNVVTKPTPTAIDFTFTAPADLSYDGTPKTASVTSSKDGIGNIKVKYYDKDGTKVDAPINAGEYSVKIDVEEGSGYAAVNDLTSSDWKFEIAKANSQVSADNVTVTYGEKFTLTANVEKSKSKAADVDKVDFYVVKDDDAVLLGTANVSYTSKDVGAATLEINTCDKALKIGDNIIAAEYGGSVNLNGSKNETITVSLKQKEVGLLWSGCATRTYDKTKSNVTATATGIENGDGEIGVSVTGGDKINANPADMYYIATATALTGDNCGYYKLPSNASQFYRIEQIDVQIEWSGETEFTYDGNEKELKATVKNAVLGDTVNVIMTGNKGVDVNSYTAQVVTVDNTNYIINNPESLTKQWSIARAEDNEITNLSLEGWTYGKTPNTPTATSKYATPTYTYSTEENGTYTDTVPTNAGKYWVKASVGETKNYAAAVSKPISFEIAKANSYVTTEPTKAENLVYTGGKLDLIAADGKAYGGNIKYSTDGENFIYDFKDIPCVTDADDYKVYYKVIGDENHNDTAAVLIEVKVAKKPINTAITLTAPVKNAKPQTSIETDEYTAKVLWSPEIEEGAVFAKNTSYSATITITPKENYTTDSSLEYTLDGAESVVLNADGSVTALFSQTAGGSGSGISSGGGSSATVTYTVEFETNGADKKDAVKVVKNSKLSEPDAPAKDGYVFDGWYTDAKFTAKYDFDSKVTKSFTLYAKWAEEQKDDKKDDDDKPSGNNWKNPFGDVNENDWFFDDVKYAFESGLMSGISDSEFAPDELITRAMFVTVLYRAEGEPEVNRSIVFSDVKADYYYANAVNWAAQNGIVAGYSETVFAPDDTVTREQIAAILYRYAQFKGYDVSFSEDTNILSYTDFDEISEYAVEAMQYAVGSGLMKGKSESTLNPKDSTTRAEIAAILNRFAQNNK